MKRLLIAGLTACLLSLGWSAPAQAAGTGYYNSPGTVTMLDGCFYVPYTAQLTLDIGTDLWSLDTRITYPDGTLFGSGYDYGETGGSIVVNDEMFFCDGFDDLGTYTMTGILSTWDYEIGFTETRVTIGPTYFDVVAPPSGGGGGGGGVVEPSKVRTIARMIPLGEPYTFRERFAVKVRVRTARDVNQSRVRVRVEYKNFYGQWIHLEPVRIKLNQNTKIGGYSFISRSNLKVRLKVLLGPKTKPSTSEVVTLNAAKRGAGPADLRDVGSS